MLTIAPKAVGKKDPDTGTEDLADEDETMVLDQEKSAID